MNDLEVLARTLWGEARNQSVIGMAAVGCVIRNRANNPRWWGDTIMTVCQHPDQFTCWNQGDPNRPKLLAVTVTDPIYARALSVAGAIMDGTQPDVTRNADSYVNLSIARPSWTHGRVPCAIIGAHAFYRLELHA